MSLTNLRTETCNSKFYIILISIEEEKWFPVVEFVLKDFCQKNHSPEFDFNSEEECSTTHFFTDKEKFTISDMLTEDTPCIRQMHLCQF